MVRVVAALALGLALGPAGPAGALEAEVARYYMGVGDICRTGPTPEIARLYEEAALAVERAQYGGGRAGNFWGLRSPEQFWLDCVQSPDGRD